MIFPEYRPRRMRQSKNFRKLISETKLDVSDLVMPFFVKEGKNIKEEIKSMPGQFHYSIDTLAKEIKKVNQLKIPAIMLFGIPDKKDPQGRSAYAKDGIIQKCIQELKGHKDDLIIITDLCLCQYTDTGHCGIINKNNKIDNDATLKILNKIALSHAQAGADMLAPSDMMDGRVAEIRATLDEAAFDDIPIMAYSVKYCSAFYGPFRGAANSAPKFGDRKSYQMDPANSDEAIREANMDIEEGADIIMVKPALSYLDIIRRLKDETNYPIAAYSVSGEYSMIMAAVQKGYLDKNQIIKESLTSIKRAGANIIISYFAMDAAQEIL